MAEQAPMTEVLQRTRRIETRLTNLIVAMGVEHAGQKPKFLPGLERGVVHAPSQHSTLKEILDAIPQDFPAPVDLYIGSDRICAIRR